jgi:replicative DNA helicase
MVIFNSNYRVEVERCIIGTCLTGNYAIPLDYLKSSNFSNKERQIIFSLILKYGETEPIDMICIKRLILKHYDESTLFDVSSEMVKSIDLTFGNGCIDMHCLILLELDIRNKALVILQNELLKCRKDELAKIDTLKQCFNFLSNFNNDVFESIETINSYLLTNLGEHLDGFEEIYKAIPKLAERIKQKNFTNKIINNLGKINNSSFSFYRSNSLDIAIELLLKVIYSEEKKVEEMYHSLIKHTTQL